MPSFVTHISQLYGQNRMKAPLTLSCSFCFMIISTFAHAQKSPLKTNAPLHIKVSPHTTHANRNKITIHTGKHTQQHKQNNSTKISKTHTPKQIGLNIEPILQGNTHTPLTPVSAKYSPNAVHGVTKKKKGGHHINTTPCLASASLDQNTKEDLANSLKQYLTTQGRDPKLIDDIYTASKTVGVDFDILIIKAMIESDLGRVMHSPTSSAQGVFQYIKPTWLTLIKRYGQRIGRGEIANALSYDYASRTFKQKENSQLSMEDVLNYRLDSATSSLIKAHQTKAEQRILSNYTPHPTVSVTDHYIAHMLGLSLAQEFYGLLRNKSPLKLANLSSKRFQQAAHLNPHFFFKGGKALDATQAYERFSALVERKYNQLNAIAGRYGNGQIIKKEPCALPTIKTVRQSHSRKAPHLLSTTSAPLEAPMESANNQAKNKTTKSRLALSALSQIAKTQTVKLIKVQE